MNTLSLISFTADSINNINYDLAENKSVSVLTDSALTVDSLYAVLSGRSEYGGNLSLFSMECRDYPEVVRRLCGFVSLKTGLYEDSTVKNNLFGLFGVSGIRSRRYKGKNYHFAQNNRTVGA